ncbi:hypothetical protein CCH79_00010278, partial [Gambusia affinis]
MDRWKGRVALVTGASVGIGATIAKELVRYGMTVVGCARSLDKIQALAAECKSAGLSGVLIPMKCDLTNAEDIQSMFAAIKAQHKGVDVCINNAGLAHPDSLLSGKTSAWKNMLDSLAAECQSAGYSGVLIPFKCDLTNVDEIQSMFAAIKAQHNGVDVCINNAGLAHAEPLLSGKTSAWKNMLDVRMVLIHPGRRDVWLLIPRGSFYKIFFTISQVNIVALSVCTRESYQSMKERKIDDGHIINLNSMCGHRVLPNADIHFYTGTKYAVTALTEGLRQELRDAKTHIRATVKAPSLPCISPGLVETEFARRLYSQNAEKAASVYSSYKVNVMALSICTREAYQSMKERNVDDGHIINLNSICGHIVINSGDIHFYTATKYAVSALTEGLRQELREAKTHIRATSISPGIVETEFAHRFYSESPDKATATYNHLKALEAIDVANAVVYVLSAPPHVQVGDVVLRPVEQEM